MADYITKIRTQDGDLPYDYNSLANKPNLNPIASETLLASGTIGTDYVANNKVLTGIKISDLRQYKRFLFIWKGSTNTGLNNLYLCRDNKALARISTGGAYIVFEWIDDEKTMISVYCWAGNPSLILSANTQFVKNTEINQTQVSAMGMIPNVITVEPAEDDSELYLQTASTPTITYEWAIKGLLK